MPPKLVNSDEKRKNIMKAAMSVFMEYGIRNTRMMDIANAAGIGKGTIYEYFKSKEEILIFTFSEMENEIHQQIEDRITEKMTASEILYLLTDTVAEVIFTFDIRGLRVNYEFMLESMINNDFKSAVIDSCRKSFLRNVESTASIINKGIETGEFKCRNTETISEIYLAWFDGLILYGMMFDDLKQLKEKLRITTEILIHYLKHGAL